MKLGLGLGLNKNSFGGLPISEAFAWYDFTDSSTISSSEVSDKSGNGHTLNIPEGSEPVFGANGAVFDGTKWLESAEAASVWNFLHNNSDEFEIFVRFRGTSAATGYIMGNGTSSNTAIGWRLQHTNATSLGRVVAVTGNGSASVQAFNSADAIAPTNEYKLVNYVKSNNSLNEYNHMGFVNGGAATTGQSSTRWALANTNTPTDSDGQILYIGRVQNTLSARLVGEIQEIFIFKTRLSALKRQAMTDYFEIKYSDSYTARPTIPLVHLNGQSNMVGFDSIANATNPAFTNPQTMTNVEIYNRSTNAFTDLIIGDNNVNGSTTSPTTLGPEGGTALELLARQSVSQDEYMAKYAFGGQKIVEFLSGGSQYSNLSDTWWKSIEEMESQGKIARNYWFWLHGQSDAAGSQSDADNYYPRLNTLYSERVAQTRGLGIDRICVGQTQNDDTPATYLTEIQAAQAQFCNDATNRLLLDRPWAFADNVHMDADTATQYGRDFVAWIYGEVRYSG